MAGLISPKPVSYLQHGAQYSNYNRGGLSNYSETPPLPGNGLMNIGHSHQPLPPFLPHNPLTTNGPPQEDNKIYTLVIELTDPATRESALMELSKKREQYDDLALILWHSFGMYVSKFVISTFLLSLTVHIGIMPALLQEIVSVYPLLSPPNLTAHVSNRVCNALALLQCVASHPETRPLFLNGLIYLLSLSSS